MSEKRPGCVPKLYMIFEKAKRELRFKSEFRLAGGEERRRCQQEFFLSSARGFFSFSARGIFPIFSKRNLFFVSKRGLFFLFFFNKRVFFFKQEGR